MWWIDQYKSQIVIHLFECVSYSIVYHCESFCCRDWRKTTACGRLITSIVLIIGPERRIHAKPPGFQSLLFRPKALLLSLLPRTDCIYIYIYIYIYIHTYTCQVNGLNRRRLMRSDNFLCSRIIPEMSRKYFMWKFHRIITLVSFDGCTVN